MGGWGGPQTGVAPYLEKKKTPTRAGLSDKHTPRLFGRHLRPHREPILRRQRFEHIGNVGGVHGAQALTELGDVLLVLELLEQVSSGALLLMRHGLEHAVAIQQ